MWALRGTVILLIASAAVGVGHGVAAPECNASLWEHSTVIDSNIRIIQDGARAALLAPPSPGAFTFHDCDPRAGECYLHPLGNTDRTAKPNRTSSGECSDTVDQDLHHQHQHHHQEMRGRVRHLLRRDCPFVTLRWLRISVLPTSLHGYTMKTRLQCSQPARSKVSRTSACLRSTGQWCLVLKHSDSSGVCMMNHARVNQW
jgi:hypothetical protein